MDIPNIIVDVGTTSTRVGITGQDQPRVVNPSYVAQLLAAVEQLPLDAQRYFTGDQSLNSGNTQFDIRPVYNSGVVQDYNLYEILVRNSIVNNMQISLEDCPNYSVLVTEDNVNRRDQREKLAQLYFEAFNFKSLYFCRNAAMSCYASGRATGVVVDSGTHTTSASIVHDGYVYLKTSKKAPVGGETLTTALEEFIKNTHEQDWTKFWSAQGSSADYLRRVFLRALKESIYRDEIKLPDKLNGNMEIEGINGNQQADQDQEDLDRQFQPEPNEPDQQIQPEPEKIEVEEQPQPANPVQQSPEVLSAPVDIGPQLIDLQLPDKQVITIDKVGVRDVIFSGTQGDMGFKGVQYTVNDLLNQSEFDFKSHLYSNIIVAGGNSLGRGFAAKLQRYINILSPKSKAKVIALPERRYSSWVGTSIMGSIPALQSYWINKADWAEYGCTIFDKKCP